jgi:hypothetical protein
MRRIDCRAKVSRSRCWANSYVDPLVIAMPTSQTDREYQTDDAKPGVTTSFSQSVQLHADESIFVLASFTKSRRYRDEVNALAIRARRIRLRRAVR